MRDVAISLNRPAGMSRWGYRLRSKKALPKANEQYQRGRAIEEGDLYPGDKYLTAEGQVCTVLTHELVFMGYSSVVGFTNGAVRRLSPSAVLYEILPAT